MVERINARLAATETKKLTMDSADYDEGEHVWSCEGG